MQDFVWEKSRDTETELRVVYPSPKIHSKFVRETEISLCNFRSVRKYFLPYKIIFLSKFFSTFLALRFLLNLFSFTTIFLHPI